MKNKLPLKFAVGLVLFAALGLPMSAVLAQGTANRRICALRLGLRVVLRAAASAPVSRACAIRVANIGDFPHPPEARRSLGSKHVLIADESAKMNKLLPCINRIDVRLFQIHLGKYTLDDRFNHSVIGTDYLWDAHCRPPLRIIRRFQ